MKVGDLCVRDVVFIGEEESVSAAAELMRLHEVGSVLVVEKVGGLMRPLGIITGGDLVADVVAPNRDAEVLTVGDIMISDLIVAQEDETLWEVADLMREQAVRQVPIVDEQGYLTGIFCMDDVLHVVTSELTDLMKFIDTKHSPDITDRA